MVLCACGCGGEIIIKRHHKYYGIPKYIMGHHIIGNILFNKTGISPSIETRNKISKSLKKINRRPPILFGEKNGVWKGGRNLSNARQHAKRKRSLGFIPLNDCREDGWVGHHIDYDYVIYIPEELHKSVWHSVTKDINMNIINDKVYEWFVSVYLKR